MYLVNFELFFVSTILIVNQIHTQGGPSAVKNCKKDPMSGEMVEMKDSPCESIPCPIKRGTNSTVSLTFVADDDYEDLYHVAYANFSNIRTNFPGLHNKNACPYLHPKSDENQAGCPLQKGQEYLYKHSMYVMKEIPKIENFMVHWGIRDRALKKDVFCYEFPASIV